jgi:hypothetical protein
MLVKTVMERSNDPTPWPGFEPPASGPGSFSEKQPHAQYIFWHHLPCKWYYYTSIGLATPGLPGGPWPFDRANIRPSKAPTASLSATPRKVCTANRLYRGECVLRAVVQFVQQKPKVVVLLPYAW